MTCFHKKAKLDAALKQLDTPPKDTRTHPRQSPRLGRGRHGRCRRDGGQRLPRGDEPPAAATAPAAAVRRPRTAGPGRAAPRPHRSPGRCSCPAPRLPGRGVRAPAPGQPLARREGLRPAGDLGGSRKPVAGDEDAGVRRGLPKSRARLSRWEIQPALAGT